MSGWDLTLDFEEDLMSYFGLQHALCHNTGTSAIHAAMWACGVGVGDEVISQSMTFWGHVAAGVLTGGHSGVFRD